MTQVYHSKDGDEAAIDTTLYITLKWFPLVTVRIPLVVLVKFRQLLDRPLIVEQYDHYGPLMAGVCTVPVAQFLLETLVQPLLGYAVASLGGAADFVEDVVQVRQAPPGAVPAGVRGGLPRGSRGLCGGRGAGEAGPPNIEDVVQVQALATPRD